MLIPQNLGSLRFGMWAMIPTLKASSSLSKTHSSAHRIFALSSGGKAGTLVVTIPTNVDWRQVGKRTQVLYTVEFSSTEGRNLGVRKGSCWEDELEKCAAQIVQDAKKAARKMD